MIKGSLMLHLGPIWYHSEPSDVPYSQNLPRPISWFGLFLQQNDSSMWDSLDTVLPHIVSAETILFMNKYLESFCCKKSPNQEIGLGRFWE